MFRSIPTRAIVTAILLMALTQPRLPADLPNLPTDQKPLLPHFAHNALTFERNVGQTDKSVQFLSRGSGYTLFIKPNEAVFFLKKSAAPVVDKRSPFQPHLQSIKTTPTSGTNVQMQLIGANSKAHALPTEPLLSTSNYLIGNDRTKWHTNVPNYVKVGFSNVYSGVDVVYYGNQGRLEYDFIINPTAKPSAIKLRFAGVKSVKALSNGNLLLAIGNGSLQWHAPIAYQNINGKRHYVKADYQLQSKNEFSFRIGNYDNSKPLVIDPKLLYSTYIGGSNEDVANGIAVDKAGSTYITGTTYSVDFPTTVGSFQTTAGNGSNVFVTKFSPDGKSLIYSTFIGGDNNESGSAIVLDSTGNAYITGQTYSSNFPTTPNAFQSTPQGRADAFLTQLSPNGQSLAYSTYIGGSLDDNATCIALDSLNQVYLGGWANSPNFPTTTGALRGGNSGGAYDGFVVKFALLGTPPLYSGYLGGTGYDQVNGVAVDTEGNAYVTGTTTSIDFPVTPKALRTISSGYPSAFVSKINNDGTSLLYSTFLNAKNWVLGYGIAVDSSGSAYITGATAATDYLVSAAAFQKTVGGRFDAFVTKLSPNGRSLVYSTFLGGAKDDLGVAIVLDNSGSAFVTGQTYSSDFPTTPASFQTSGAGGVDGFIAQLSSSGQSLLYSTYLGGKGDDVARGIALESGGKSYIAGYTTSTDFPATADSYQPTNPSFAGTAFVVGLPGIKDTTTSASSTTGAIGETLILKAVLTQDRDGSSLTNKNLTSSVDGVNIGVVNTDDTGTASLLYPLDEAVGVGSHTLTVAFAGDSSFNSSLATTSITVNKSVTTLTANDSSGRVGDILQLTTTLTRNTDNHPVVNRTVVFV
ncbi:MAG: SBBP repeat-containing protein, partial [Armatimonadetes bacterium]|nr:SBBP repeat-containing protein [Armatimonadota bacterium]